MMAEESGDADSRLHPRRSHLRPPSDIEVTDRADTEHKPKTTLPKIAGSYKLPPSSLLHRPDEQQAVHEEELKVVAQVLTAKYAEFEVHGQVTQINPGPVVTTFEFKPEAGIKYSRIIGLTDDLCLALRAESILVERMPGKSTVGIQVPNRERELIWLRENIESQEFLGSKVQAHDRHGQGHQRTHRRCRSGRNASSAYRRFDRNRQERGRQRHDHVDPV
jgi:DNA segregation ATPase FtsK/SpoIIIE-like protein